MLIKYCKMKYYFLILSLGLLIKCEREPFIIGGQVANGRHFAHAAFFRVRCTNENRGFSCGSSIVNQRILLTAAHCVDVCFGENKMLVTVGHSEHMKGTVYGVHSVYSHEEFDERTCKNDIALIRLSKDLKFSFSIQRVVLLNKPPYFEKAQVAGWGRIQEGKNIVSHILLYVDQYVWKPARCRKIGRNLPPGSFCASSKHNNYFPSDGDSGGALTVRGYIQIGITSFKVLPISKAIRGVTMYTDIGYHYNWITMNSKKLYCGNS